jgi:hypothetical protein
MSSIKLPVLFYLTVLIGLINACTQTATQYNSSTGSSSSSSGSTSSTSSGNYYSGTNDGLIADHNVALESVLRSIPQEYINKARTNYHIIYQHTSHGTHVAYGLFGLPGFKTGDNVLFGIQNNATDPDTNKLDFHNNGGLDSYSPGSQDLSQVETGFITQTQAYLDEPAHSNINIVMWSWCSIAGHNVSNNYIPGMQELIDEYGTGGSKIGTGPGQTRVKAVNFIFMTGHAEESANVGPGCPKDQAKLITDYCKANGFYCLDYYSIDTHDMANTYYEDGGDDTQSASFGGRFNLDWQTNHTLGVDWYYNLDSPGGSQNTGDHLTQHITANRKAYAMWWILARLAGWDGISK